MDRIMDRIIQNNGQDDVTLQGGGASTRQDGGDESGGRFYRIISIFWLMGCVL